jgi:DNA-binding IclR family transcriptional regulator
VTEAQVLETLRRRPCTLTDLAAGLGIPLSATVKLLDALRARDAVSASTHDGQTFFTATY